MGINPLVACQIPTQGLNQCHRYGGIIDDGVGKWEERQRGDEMRWWGVGREECCDSVKNYSSHAFPLYFAVSDYRSSDWCDCARIEVDIHRVLVRGYRL